MINSKFSHKTKLINRAKNKLFFNFKSRALANNSIYVVIKPNKNLHQILEDIKYLKQQKNLIIKTLIYNKNLIFLNDENWEFYYNLGVSKNKLVFLSLIVVTHAIQLFFDIISKSHFMMLYYYHKHRR